MYQFLHHINNILDITTNDKNDLKQTSQVLIDF